MCTKEMDLRMSFYLHILFILSLSLCLIHTVFSRSLSSTDQSNGFSYSTTLFDVSSSVQRTLNVLSSQPSNANPTHKQELGPLTTLPSSTFSLSLHPRSSLVKTHHKDYESLTRSRLDRDVARVNSIAKKLEVTHAGTVHQFNMTSYSGDIQAPVTSGLSQGIGEYLSRLGIGTPTNNYYLVIDTGSDVNWLQCLPCSKCYNQSDPIFDPSQSSTYNALTCDSTQCQAISTCQSGSCPYQVNYGDGSSTTGNLATETLSFGNSGTVPNIAIGCGHDNEGLFVGADGLLGLGRGSLSFPSQFQANSFSYCLVDRDSTGSSTLDFNSAAPSDSVIAPLLMNSQTQTYHYVGLTGLNVGGQPVSIPPSAFALEENGSGGVIVDSGTTVSFLNTEAYNPLRDAFVNMTQNLPRVSGVSIFDTCYHLTSVQNINVPTLSFQFSGGQSLTLPVNNYLIPVDSKGTTCFAFAPTTASPSIIGNIQQQEMRVTYDLANSLIGFSVNKC